MKPTPFASLTNLLETRAALQGSETLYTFLHDSGEAPAHLTYGELAMRAQNIAAHLQHEVKPGEPVLLLLPPGLDLIVAFFGCLYAGTPAVPLPPPHHARLEQQKERLLVIAADARPGALLSSREILDSLAPLHDELAQAIGAAPRHLAIDQLDKATDPFHSQADADTIAFLQYTSGSTASPKGVMLSHGNLLHNSELIHRAFNHTPQSQGVIWLPPYHDMGLIGGILQPLYGGFPVTLMSPASFLMRPLRWLNAISQYRATTSGGPNFAYELCAKKITAEQKATLDLSCWRVAFAGAEPVNAQTLNGFAEAFACCGFQREAFLPCYGLAESTLLVTGFKTQPIFQTAKHQHRELVGAGQAGHDTVVRIVDSDSGEILPDEKIGEVWVCGPSVAKGYWHGDKARETVFDGRLPGQTMPFLRTGDLGFLREGELFLTGRSKDLIIIGGRNHFAEDIERTVAQAHSLVAASAAVAVQTDAGEQLVIMIEIDRLARLEPDRQKEIKNAVLMKVAGQHDVRAWEIRLVRAGSLPRTTSGKIQRHRCVELAISAPTTSLE